MLGQEAKFYDPDVLLAAGISTLAQTPEKANVYLQPLLNFAAAHVPRVKHKETPLYILCTAGMRLLPDR
jgi:Golgi nucleoside diphosphatase